MKTQHKSEFGMTFGAMRKAVPMAGLITAFVFSGGIASGADTRSLVDNSPFLPAGFSAPEDRRQSRPEPTQEPVASPLDSIELRGIYVIGGEHHFSFFDSENEQGFWLSSDEMEGGYAVVEFDQRSDSIVMRHGDVERPITLRESRVQELSGRQLRAMQGGPQGGQQGGPQGRQQAGGQQRGGGNNASPEEVQERLREAQEELRRRRAIRTGQQ